MLKVLVACEFSGTVRDAFRARGHDAWSCDLLPTERPGPHLQGDVLEHLDDGWDLMIAHPSCQHLAVSGARWFDDPRFPDKRRLQQESLDFVCRLRDANIPRIAIENPVSIISTRLGKPTQIVQPWWFGHGEVKKTCLWLFWLPPLMPTAIVAGREQRVWKEPTKPDRWKERSRTLPGVAAAMADAWGSG